MTTKPRSIVFNRMSVGQQDTKELELTVRKPDEVKITKVSIQDEKFQIVPKDSDKPGVSRYDVKFLGSNLVGPISARIKVETEGGDKPFTEVFVRAIVIGDLNYPRTIFLTKETGDFKPQEITVTSRSDKPFKITGIKDPDGKLKTEIIQAKGPRAVIKAEVKDQDVPYPKTERHNLLILTSDKHQPEIEISYMISDDKVKSHGRRKGDIVSPIRAIPPLPGKDGSGPIGIQ